VREWLIVLLALACGMSGLVAWRTLRRERSNVARLNAAIQRIESNDFSEIAALAQANGPLAPSYHTLSAIGKRVQWGKEELEALVADVTRELRLRKEEAESATQAKSRFIAAASHDLRQPMHAMGLFIARLGQLPLGRGADGLVDNLESAVQSMQDLLDGLLDLSKLEAGAVKANFQAHPIEQTFQAVRTALSAQARAQGLRFRVRPTGLWALTDPALLQRVVMNLGHNALRYTSQGAVMIVCRKVQNGMGVRIDVMDSGRGIDPAHQHHIFQEFYRVDGESADVSKGMGLGLHIVARTTEVLGASLAVRSALGCGARFSVTLPIARPRPAAAQPERAQGVGARYADLQGIHVVVLEPDEQVRAALEGLLLSWGCAVFAAASLEPALRRLQDGGFTPSAIVCDIALTRPSGVDAVQDGPLSLPDLGAVSVLRRCVGVQIPACLFGGPGELALRAQWQEQGVVVLDKPVRPAKLRAWLRRLRAEDAAAD
jgi:signal transduction histidine kinase/CheY-like chemotaxis protein